MRAHLIPLPECINDCFMQQLILIQERNYRAKLRYAVVAIVSVVLDELADVFDIPPFLLRPHSTLTR